EFSDKCSPNFYDQFEFPYFLHYSSELKLENYTKSKYLAGMIFDFNNLFEMHKEGSLFSFVQNFFQLTKDLNIELVLRSDWDSNYFPSLTEVLDFDSVALPINDKVEVCYRNVELGKLTKLLDIIKKQF
ncbi:MAG: hypothetical protein KAG61_00735, partial [Bacteriovoracaceae bacterium]|nr:hypothetical protein [Bacteriovoracaceae bacterium]